MYVRGQVAPSMLASKQLSCLYCHLAIPQYLLYRSTCYTAVLALPQYLYYYRTCITAVLALPQHLHVCSTCITCITSVLAFPQYLHYRSYLRDSHGLYIYTTKVCLWGRTPPRLGHLAMATVSGLRGRRRTYLTKTRLH
jgi:hypothetical protein